ncbi:uncharacterized protein LOC112904027 [Agrilus planipennis]|uniref:Uncharacterized protein LOC112904027 n=1 Tax=Agrilus planipennis TaxID=224129 RepID=A0A7F5R1F9_AGRPL|nr:uncharacterized protein LOC112904027 [Agrilus planipennis]
MNCSFCSFAAFIFAVLIIFTVGTSEAKRGCSTFGHSCYGGMGKRANDEEVNAEVFQEIEQDNPEIIFTGPRNSEVDETWAPEPKLSLQQYRHFSPYLKQWF